MNIDLSNWNAIKKVFSKSQKSNMHANIASVSKEGVPNITPIGTVFLNEDGTGFLFDSFSQQLAENLKLNNNVCISAVNSSKFFWLSSFIKGQFNDYPGVRLYTKLGGLRLATDQERLLVNTRIRSLKWTKGSKLIWSDFTHVREFKVDNYRWIQYPNMMEKLI
ncbi:pyridoxamine 5'-phosphate oxidase family protein [Psychrobacter sp. CAL346-MNA-CIBAN-0220]|uniref:pyridoxamine 5'-phosphate oxidase family protein n=1 Tax=Psychrobacter sp. CAL346-MNA-CIBAN-0220 TaxID=3140457 RepID=UPI0033235D83